MAKKLKYAVFGNGSWATAIVKILCESLDKVNWYVRNPKSVNYILEESVFYSYNGKRMSEFKIL